MSSLREATLKKLFYVLKLLWKSSEKLFQESFVLSKYSKYYLTCNNQGDDAINDSRHSNKASNDGKIWSIIHLTLVANNLLIIHLVADNQSCNSRPDENENKQVWDHNWDHVEDQPGKEENTLMLVAALEEHNVAQGHDDTADKGYNLGCNADIWDIFSGAIIAEIEIKIYNLPMLS